MTHHRLNKIVNDILNKYNEMGHFENTNIIHQCLDELAEHSTCGLLHTSSVLVSSKGKFLAGGINVSLQKNYNYIPGFCEKMKPRDGNKPGFCHAIHAEHLMFSDAFRKKVDIPSTTVFSLYAPCLQCAKLITAFEINNVFYYKEFYSDEGVSFLRLNMILIKKI